MADYDVTEAFDAIENELINSMIRNMERHKAEELEEGFEWAAWQAEQLSALEQYRRNNATKFTKKFSEINSTMSQLIAEAKAAGGMDQEIKILEAIQKGFRTRYIPDTIGASFFATNDRKLDALLNAVEHDMQKAETAILRKANDEYRKAIYNAQVYANTGAGTYEKAVDMATRDMLKRGLTCVTYANGAVHTLKDYADMALRTASKRAYLQGEGEKRQEWGVHTVILNKRGDNPCPKCLPWVGRVMIDDVWSGGTAEEAQETGYPLMSTAIAGGLYH